MRGEIFTHNQIDKGKSKDVEEEKERPARKEGKEEKEERIKGGRRKGGRKKGIIWELKT